MIRLVKRALLVWLVISVASFIIYGNPFQQYAEAFKMGVEIGRTVR